MLKSKTDTGFTLIEMLVVLAILGLLASLILASLGRVRRRGDEIQALSNLRQLGTAITTYAMDNNSKLPGPLYQGQGVRYHLGDTRTFGNQLWRYLSLPEPTSVIQEARILGHAAYFRERKSPMCPSWILNFAVNMSDGNAGNPWGNQVTPSKSLWDVESSSSQWLARDVDQTHPGVSTMGWYPLLPETPLYIPKRITLFFDLSVRSVPIDGETSP